MKKFIVEPEFWELFPETKIGIVLAKNIDNSMESSAEIKKNLDEANENAEQFLEAAVFSENPVVSVWRKAYQKFKTKKGARSSIENLLKRVDKGKAVGSINPLVDIYNSISLNYGLPAGGEDIDTFAGNLRLTKAVGGEHFLLWVILKLIMLCLVKSAILMMKGQFVAHGIGVMVKERC